jgi:putative zinc finger protein
VHPFGDLSAYVDGALSSEARASVQAHLDTCALCRTRLAELRGTARLIAALPMPIPSRSLVPRVSVPFWLAPLRTFSTLASGVAIFVFVATAVVSSFPRATPTSAGSAPAAAPAPNTLSVPQATSGPGADSTTGTGAAATGGPEGFSVSAPSPAPAPNTDRAGNRTTATDTAKEVGRQDAAAPSPNAGADELTRLNRDEPGLSAFLSPWLWLWLGVAFGGLSFILGRRLRST